LDVSTLALKLSIHKTGFLGIRNFSSSRSDLIQVTFAARSAKALYSNSVLDRDTTFCFLEAHEINVSRRKTHYHVMDFLSSMLVAQSASENPVISRSVEGLHDEDISIFFLFLASDLWLGNSYIG